jgi:probable F420-dependent oxidoreductase
MSPKPFRFAVQSFNAESGGQWAEFARTAEGNGYSTLFTCDHYFGPGEIATESSHAPVGLAPMMAMAMAAAATTTLKVGCRVFAADYHNPVVLAKEIATLDLLSDGRVETGIGAGWIHAEYDGLGIEWRSPGARIDKLRETIDLLQAHWSGEPIEEHGEYVNVSGFSGLPRPVNGRIPLMIGGGAPKVLALAGERADIVSLNFNNSAGKIGAASVSSSTADETAKKVEWVKAGAGDRFDDLELEIGAYFTAVVPTADAASAAADAVGARMGMSGDAIASHPHAFIGSIEQIIDLLQERRERYGISYVTVADRNATAFAPIVAALSGT